MDDHWQYPHSMDWFRGKFTGTNPLTRGYPHDWLVVLPVLKKISQWEGLSYIVEHKKYLKPQTRLLLAIHYPEWMITWDIPKNG